MAAKAVAAHGKAGGAGAAGAGTPEPGEQPHFTPTPSRSQQQADNAAAAEQARIDREKAVMQGGPGQDGQAFSVRYGEREFKSQAELTSYLDTLSNENASLKKKVETRVAEPTPPATQQTPQVKFPDIITDDDLKDIENDLLIDPKKALRPLLEKVGQNVEARLTARYTAQQNMNQWWDGFYNDHPEFQKHKNIVQMVFNSRMKDLEPLTMAQAADKLAEYTQETILQVSGGTRADTREKTGKAVVEGAGSRAPAAPAPTTQETPKTLSQLIRQRAATRRGANGKATVA